MNLDRPNIILIMTDNQSASKLGCYGNPQIGTPHIDSLAASGTQFRQAFCVNAMCSPCRASVFTGLMPSQHGIHNWLDDRLVDQWPEDVSAIDEFVHLPGLLKQAGYVTGLFGKYHLGAPAKAQLGFDEWVTMATGHTRSFYGNEMIRHGERTIFEGHSVNYFADAALDFLDRQRMADTPFFAFIPFNGPYGHWPSIAGTADHDFAAMYSNADMSFVPREGLNPHVLDRFAQRVSNGTVREQFKGPLILPNNRDALRNYCSQISLIDHHVGRIVAKLEETGLSENTVVIFTSDHGFSLGHHGIWGHGAASFPASAHGPSYHIPLIMAGPDIQPASVRADMVSQIDLFPTMARLAGCPDRAGLPSAARDLFATDIGVEDPAVFMEQEETRAIRTKDWLYVHRFSKAPSYTFEDELYDLRRDGEERQSLINSADHQDKLAQLHDRLSRYFVDYAEPAYDLWCGGSAKSNVTFDGLWRDAWGEDWRPQAFGATAS